MTREPNEIIGFAKSRNEKQLVIITGKNLVRNEQKANQLFIFTIESNANNTFKSVDFKKRILVKEMPKFDKVCVQFFFDEPFADAETNMQERTHLLFVTKYEIFKINIETEQTEPVFTFEPPLV